MSEHPSHGFRPFAPTEDEDLDYEPFDAPPHILWGRVGALAVALIAAFVAGRLTAPDGIPSERLDAARRDVAAAHELIDSLRAEQAILEQQRATAEDHTAGAHEGAGDRAGGAAADRRGQALTYTVKEGDTLHALAERFYGDSGLRGAIAEANGLAHPNRLTPGEELTIPPQP